MAEPKLKVDIDESGMAECSSAEIVDGPPVMVRSAVLTMDFERGGPIAARVEGRLMPGPNEFVVHITETTVTCPTTGKRYKLVPIEDDDG